MKTRSSKTKFSYACLSPSPTLSYTITKKKRRTFCDAKVIEVSEAPTGSLRVLFSFHSDKVLFRFFSDRVLLSVLRDRDPILMVLNDRVLFESPVTGSSSGSSAIDSSLWSSLLFFRFFPLFFVNTFRYFFLHYIIKKNFTQLVAKKWRITCMMQTRNIMLKIYVINFPIYKWSILLNI